MDTTIPTPVSASGAASDTSRVDRINRTVATINAEIRNLRSLAWSNGRAGRAESLIEDTTSGLLHEAVGKLQALALGVEDGESDSPLCCGQPMYECDAEHTDGKRYRHCHSCTTNREIGGEF